MSQVMQQRNNDHLYLQVAKELQRGSRDEALWTKAFALENGDEKRTQSHYIRLRVESLEAKNEPEHPETSIAHSVTYPNKTKWNKWPIIILLLIAIIGLIQLTKSSPKSSKTTAPPKIQPMVLPAESMPSQIDLETNGIKLDKANKKIWISGEIKEDTAKILKAIFTDEQSFPRGKPFIVFMDSNGGDLYASMDIGRAIRSRGNSVVAVMADAKCYSSCVFILAGGGQRIRQGSIGIHRPYLASPSGNEQQLAIWFTKVTNDAKAYLQEMRVRESLFDDMVSIAPSDIHIFESTTEMDNYGLMQFDPVIEEKIASATMTRLGISRQEFLIRQNKIKQVCTEDFSFQGHSFTYAECYSKVMSGEFTVEPN